jgi:hypothetical protein
MDPLMVFVDSHHCESNEFDKDRLVGSMSVHGGRPPLALVWEHSTKDINSPEDEPVAHCNYCGAAYNCHT